MKRLLLTTLCVIVSVVAMAQGGRMVRGVVLDVKNMPIAGATITVVNSDVSATTEANGTFTLVAPTYATEIEASAESYISTRLVIDGSYLMFKLKVDKAYAAAKAKAEEDAGIEAERKAEAERLAAEREAYLKARAEEQARLAAEREAATKERATKLEALKIEYAKHIKGYESIVGLSYSMVGNENYVGANYIGGYRINNIFFAGAGVGANMRLGTPINFVEIKKPLELSRGSFYIPIYLHFRAQLLNRRCTPFVALSAGYNVSQPQQFDLELTSIKYNASGLFINPQVGVTYRVKPKLGIYCAVGFDASMMPECIDNTGYSATIKQGFKYGINVNLGISF